MIPSAFSLRTEYTKLDTPTVIIAGERDRVIDIDQQSARLHEEIQQSEFVRVSNTGHMVHQTATLQVMAAIDQSAFGTPVRSTDSRGQG